MLDDLLPDVAPLEFSSSLGLALGNVKSLDATLDWDSVAWDLEELARVLFFLLGECDLHIEDLLCDSDDFSGICEWGKDELLVEVSGCHADKLEVRACACRHKDGELVAAWWALLQEDKACLEDLVGEAWANR